MKLKGWKNVMSFTFLQNVKAKSFRISTIILCIILALIAVAVNLLPKLLAGSDLFSGPAEMPQLTSLYVYDTTDFEKKTDIGSLGIPVKEITEAELVQKQQEVEESNAAVALVKLEKTERSYNVTVYRPRSEELITGGDCQMLADSITSLFVDAMYLNYGISEDELSDVKLGFNSQVKLYSDELNNLSEMQMIASMLLPILTALVLFMFIISYANMIAQSVATEKTSKVMELLLTSISPLSVIVGKVIAMLLVCLVQVLIMGFVMSAAFIISAPFGFIPDLITSGQALVTQGMAQAEAGAQSVDFGIIVGEIGAQISSAVPGFDIASVLLVIVTFVLGFLFYALLAGLCGASVSRAEDLATAIQPLTFVSMIGFMLSYMPAVLSDPTQISSGPNAIMLVARYLPISSPFALPSAILLGEITLLEAVISVLFLALCVVGTAILVSKIYHHIVLYSGNPLKFGQLLKFAKKK